jgi:hypothetical protein
MAPKKKPDKARIEAAVRELEALGVSFPYLLERMVSDERKLLKMRTILAALRSPRENVDDFLAFPLLSPTLLIFLEAVRFETLAPKLGLEKNGVFRDPKELLKLFVEQIGLKHSRRGAPTSSRLKVAEKRYRLGVEDEVAAFFKTLPKDEGMALARQIQKFRRGRQGMSFEQAAVHVAKAWADELIPELEKRRRQIPI